MAASAAAEERGRKEDPMVNGQWCVEGWVMVDGGHRRRRQRRQQLMVVSEGQLESGGEKRKDREAGGRGQREVKS